MKIIPSLSDRVTDSNARILTWLDVYFICCPQARGGQSNRVKSDISVRSLVDRKKNNRVMRSSIDPVALTIQTHFNPS